MMKVVVICSGGFSSHLNEFYKSNSNLHIDGVEFVFEDESIYSVDFLKLDDSNYLDDSLKTNYFNREKSFRFLNKKRKKR